MDRRIINNILSSFEKKLMKRSEIVDRFKEILQNECNKNIIRNLRQSNNHVIVLDNLSTGKLANIAHHFKAKDIKN